MDVGDLRPESALEQVLPGITEDPEQCAYAETLVHGVFGRLAEIDGLIEQASENYPMHRMAVIDRNLLRIACFELLAIDYVPPAVTINEAVEIARRYSTAESPRFVNGVVAQVVRSTPKATWDPHQAEPEDAAEEPPEETPEVETVAADSPEAHELARAGLWKLRQEDAS